MTIHGRFPLYIFRDRHFAPAGDTIVYAASAELVISAFGGGGSKGEDSLSAAFGRAAVEAYHGA
jgi:hypothetical protein